jgi:ribokinase
MSREVVVVGSVNTDYVFRVASFPEPGETAPGSLSIYPGGKGANQAVALARLGGSAALIARVGDDPFSQEALRGLKTEGLDTEYVLATPGPGGAAGIWVDQRGENSIVIAGGANLALSSVDVEAARQIIEGSKVLLVQLEVPLETVIYALKLAKQAGVTTVLDPAPAQVLPREVLALVDVITPNAGEATKLTSIDVHCWKTAALAGRWLREQGVGLAMVTMGKFGAICISAQGDVRINLPRVEVVDTTAAGDAFAAALSLGLARGLAPDAAADIAAAAGALTVTKAGAQPSLPHLKELAEIVEIPWQKS